MEYHPILFKGRLVRAILEDRKTQTRRVVRFPKKHKMVTPTVIRHKVTCPYGQKGDQLWVRETWNHTRGQLAVDSRDPHGVQYRADGERGGICRWRPSIHMPREFSRITLEVTGIRIERLNDMNEKDAKAEGVDMEWRRFNPEPGAWPCPACNGTGLHGAFGADYGVTEIDCQECDTALKSFHHLWDSINKKRGFGWDTNPWVWVVEFRKIPLK